MKNKKKEKKSIISVLWRRKKVKFQGFKSNFAIFFQIWTSIFSRDPNSHP